MEHQLFTGDVPETSTFKYHKDRPRAPHLEEAPHQERLYRARDFVAQVAGQQPVTVSDLGCGDGGLLSLIQGIPGVDAWGYDFHPASQEGWKERGVKASRADVFGKDQRKIRTGDVIVMTEVLEHLARPHEALRWARERASHLVCSSPWNEGPDSHSDCHAWAWDLEGYAAMIQSAGWGIVRHEQAGLFQLVLAV